jgi:hypothetical protein
MAIVGFSIVMKIWLSSAFKLSAQPAGQTSVLASPKRLLSWEELQADSNKSAGSSHKKDDWLLRPSLIENIKFPHLFILL